MNKIKDKRKLYKFRVWILALLCLIFIDKTQILHSSFDSFLSYKEASKYQNSDLTDDLETEHADDESVDTFYFPELLISIFKTQEIKTFYYSYSDSFYALEIQSPPPRV